MEKIRKKLSKVKALGVTATSKYMGEQWLVQVPDTHIRSATPHRQKNCVS